MSRVAKALVAKRKNTLYQSSWVPPLGSWGTGGLSRVDDIADYRRLNTLMVVLARAQALRVKKKN